MTADDNDVTDAPRQPLGRLTMDGRPVRPLRRDASENRERILRAGSSLLRMRGPATTMEQVAVAASVGKGTLYRNYPSLAALAEAVLDPLARELQHRVLRDLGPYGEPALQRLDRFLVLATGFAVDNLELLCIARDGRRDDPRATLPYRWQRLVVSGLLAEAVAAGEADPADLTYLPDALLALTEPGLVRHQLEDVGLGREEIIAGLRRLAAAAVRPG